TTGVLEKECAFLNRRFFTRITKQRPYVILKWAQTADGYFAPDDGTQQWITGEESKALVHKWRAEEDAVLVGKRTAMADDPALTVRAVKGRNPVRILIDANLEVDQQTKLYNSEAPTIVLNALKTEKTNNIHFIQLEDMHFYLTEKIMYQLYLMDIQSVIIEGGANILNQFIQAGLWDEARIFTSANPWGNGLKAPLITNISGQVEQVGNDTLTTIFNT
ncbi:MAG: RibD family protein, partial [Pedobacter sp.]